METQSGQNESLSPEPEPSEPEGYDGRQDLLRILLAVSLAVIALLLGGEARRVAQGVKADSLRGFAVLLTDSLTSSKRGVTKNSLQP